MPGANQASKGGGRRAWKEGDPNATTTPGVCTPPTGGLDAVAEALGLSAREMAAAMDGFLANRMVEAQELAAGDFRRWLAARHVEPPRDLVARGGDGGGAKAKTKNMQTTQVHRALVMRGARGRLRQPDRHPSST